MAVRRGLGFLGIANDRSVLPAAGSVTVVGQGSVDAPPDMARVNIGVEVTRAAVRSAVDEANEALGRVLDALRAKSVPSEDMQSRWVGVHRAYDGSEGFTAQNMLTVTIRDVRRVGDVLQAAIDAAGDAVRESGISFEVGEQAHLLASARQEAMHDAIARAQDYAALAHRRLGRILHVSEVGAPGRLRDEFFAETGMVRARSVPTEPGLETLRTSVTVVFALE